MGRMCDSKNRYPTEARAIRAALKHSRYNGCGVRTYFCPICKGWHLTTHTQDGESLKNDFAKARDEGSDYGSLEW